MCARPPEVRPQPPLLPAFPGRRRVGARVLAGLAVPGGPPQTRNPLSACAGARGLLLGFYFNPILVLGSPARACLPFSCFRLR
jgi:hypothetical protein